MNATSREARFIFSNNEVHLWHLNFLELQYLKNQLHAFLSLEEQELYASFSTQKKQKEFIFTRGCLRFLLGQYLKKEPSQLQFTILKNGKPFLKEGDLFFNLSHSHNQALIAISQDFEVGVDLEYLHSKRSIQKIAHRYFSEQEKTLLQKTPQEKKEKVAYQLWTAKEALMKGSGEGLPLGIDQVVIPYKENADKIELNEGLLKGWSLHFFSPDPNYVGALAFHGLGAKIKTYSLTSDLFRDSF